MGEHEMQMEKQLRDDTITHNESYFHIFNGFVASNTVQHKHTHTNNRYNILICFLFQKSKERRIKARTKRNRINMLNI